MFAGQFSLPTLAPLSVGCAATSQQDNKIKVAPSPSPKGRSYPPKSLSNPMQLSAAPHVSLSPEVYASIAELSRSLDTERVRGGDVDLSSYARLKPRPAA